MSNGRLLRAAIGRDILQVVGTATAYSAKLAEREGFKALYLSGGGVSASSLAVPDLGFISAQDIAVDCARITAASHLPLLVDIDTGFGETPLHVRQTIRLLEKAGAAGVQIEDQVALKRCGHLEGKKTVGLSVMCERIDACATGRRSKDTVILARTDCYASEGIDGVIKRSKAYVDAGADWIFPEALPTLEAFEKVTKALGPRVPVLANITEYGRTPLLTTEELQFVGVQVALYPLSAFRAMSAAAAGVYRAIKRDGTQKKVLPLMQSRAELYDVLGYAEVQKVVDTVMKAKAEDG